MSEPIKDYPPYMDYPKPYKPHTNADRIRAMTDEKLAEWLVSKTFYRESAWSEPSYLNFLTGRSEEYKAAVSGTKEWLQQPAERRTE